ncbi:uncharacterized protein EDB93DRAFT_1248967 [Suillus bovinus]|uniref:uncharacterized protein n=1 Tax=Suillus bovinus TaxID=48563 RepID=UPI001B85CA56|nr:uncharacterized protein EDB93DRAFT_1248967 [Suillus bovinus]KAG2153050.1 hypothetical protein EDB93DRAFT_1248967 [Suillus bovinus]
MSSSAQDLALQLDIGKTFGALFIGVTIAAVILDALHLALIVHCVYYYLVVNYANVSALSEIVWSFKLQIVVEFFVICGVHILYVYRIWIISKGRSRILPITVGVIEILLSGVAIALIWALYQCHLFSDLLKIEWATFMTLGTITFADIVVASSLCYLLATSRTGFSGTNSLITKLMVYIHMFDGSYDYTMPHNFIFIAIEFLLAKVYINAYFALLNARHYTQVNTDSTHNPYPLHNRPEVYRPELHIRNSEDEELQVSRKNVFRHPDDEAMHPSRFVMPQQSTAVATDMTFLPV